MQRTQFHSSLRGMKVAAVKQWQITYFRLSRLQRHCLATEFKRGAPIGEYDRP
jgi:hypothetical protein